MKSKRIIIARADGNNGYGNFERNRVLGYYDAEFWDCEAIKNHLQSQEFFKNYIPNTLVFTEVVVN